ncbi:MAG: aspartate ammonia-lyase [Methanoregulaceae archaeon]|nr:aspartate ammonia-lyase [Methanoregulaceae archaeon]
MNREERDPLGSLMIEGDVYYGIQTVRAIRNFPVSGIRAKPDLVRAYVLVKKAAAIVNIRLGILDTVRGDAIIRAADEVLGGLYADQFPVDVFQAGAGTSFNMNINEVIANRALELLGHPRGDYAFLSPNDHVNLCQSTNDTYPTATHIAAISTADHLLRELVLLEDAFLKKGDTFSGIPKVGRTHLMDALPVTLGQEFRAYGTAIGRAAARIRERRNDLLEIPLGGTATGTGANSHPKYRTMVVAELSALTGYSLVPARNSFEALQSRSQLVAFSGALRELALELIRIANDIRLLGSGPEAGLGEIILPAVQPGSSAMAGKVNPVIAECLDMIGFQVLGNDTVIALGAQAGQLELNVMTPVICHNILESVVILSSFLPVFRTGCIDGINADEARCRSYLKGNSMLATLLIPRIGFARAAEIAKESLRSRVQVREIAVREGIVTPEEADTLFDYEKMSRTIFEE